MKSLLSNRFRWKSLTQTPKTKPPNGFSTKLFSLATVSNRAAFSGCFRRGCYGNGRTLAVASHPSGQGQRTHSRLRDKLPTPDRARLGTLRATSDQCAATPVLDVMIDLAVSDMMMNCFPTEWGLPILWRTGWCSWTISFLSSRIRRKSSIPNLKAKPPNCFSTRLF